MESYYHVLPRRARCYDQHTPFMVVGVLASQVYRRRVAVDVFSGMQACSALVALPVAADTNDAGRRDICSWRYGQGFSD